MNIVLGLLLSLPILIVVHEYGHYRVARWCGVRVLRFSVGFGNVLLRRQAHEGATEFVISAIPLGGYVRWLDTRVDEVAPGDRAQAFDTKPLWQRAAIVAAGPLINLAAAVLLYAAAYWVGMDEPRAVLASPSANTLAAEAGLAAGDWVHASASAEDDWDEIESLSELQWQVTQAALRADDLQLQVSDLDGGHRRQLTLRLSSLSGHELDAAAIQRIGIGAFREPVVGNPFRGGPAERAGLRAGDRVLAIDGLPVADAQALLERIRAHNATGMPPMQWSIERAGQRMDIEVTPRLDKDGDKAIGRIDTAVGSQLMMTTVRLGPLDGLARGVRRTSDMISLSLKMLGRMLVGEASLRNLSGPITIGDYAAQSLRQGPSYFLGFLAMVSVSLGVLNLLPLPMLDGGHLMYYLFEGVTGRPVSDLWLKWLQRSGAFVLLLMMTIALSNDVARMLGLQ